MTRGSPIRSLDSAQYGELSASRSLSKFSPSVVCLIRMSSWLGFRVRVQGSGVLGEWSTLFQDLQHSLFEVHELLGTKRALVSEGLRLKQLKLTEQRANRGSAELRPRLDVRMAGGQVPAETAHTRNVRRLPSHPASC